MLRPHFDINTVFLYVIIGIIGAFLVYLQKKNEVNISGRYAYQRSNIYAFLFVAIYSIFAAMRHVSYEIGGMDALEYKRHFLESLGDISRGEGLADFEFVFLYIQRGIRYVTDNYRIYFFIIYGFIAYSFVKFLRNRIPRDLCFIPFILLSFLYLRGFNTLRTTTALSFVLLGLASIRNNSLKSFLWFFASIFVHRVSVLFLPLYFMCTSEKYQKILNSKFFYLFNTIAITLLMSIVSYVIKDELMALGIFEGNDLYYVQMNSDVDIIDNYPMFIAQVLLFCMVAYIYEKIEKNADNKVLLTCLSYDIMIIPIATVMGMWRFAEYLYIARLALWGVVITSLIRHKRMPPLFIKIIAFVCFTSWFCFRIYKEWDPMKVSPYVFDLF